MILILCLKIAIGPGHISNLMIIQFLNWYLHKGWPAQADLLTYCGDTL